MAASTTTADRAPEVEQSHTSLNEPSMEDILASIRRIIAEDQSNSLGRNGLSGLTRRAAAAPVAEEPVPSTVAEEAPSASVSAMTELDADPRTEALHHVFESAPDAFDRPAQDFSTQDPSAENRAEMPLAEAFGDQHVYDAHDRDEPAVHLDPAPAFAASDEEVAPLMSPLAGASITSSFQTLAESVVLQDPGLIERVMRESMRPLLKAWLDDHLPSIVERLVRTEIERVARGGRARNV